jgi:hypothetical protein
VVQHEVFIKGLPYEATAREIRQELERQFGTVWDLYLFPPDNGRGGRNRGIAKVVFSEKSVCDRALTIGEFMMRGRRVQVRLPNSSFKNSPFATVPGKRGKSVKGRLLEVALSTQEPCTHAVAHRLGPVHLTIMTERRALAIGFTLPAVDPHDRLKSDPFGFDDLLADFLRDLRLKPRPTLTRDRILELPFRSLHRQVYQQDEGRGDGEIRLTFFTRRPPLVWGRKKGGESGADLVGQGDDAEEGWSLADGQWARCADDVTVKGGGEDGWLGRCGVLSVVLPRDSSTRALLDDLRRVEHLRTARGADDRMMFMNLQPDLLRANETYMTASLPFAAGFQISALVDEGVISRTQVDPTAVDLLAAYGPQMAVRCLKCMRGARCHIEYPLVEELEYWHEDLLENDVVSARTNVFMTSTQGELVIGADACGLVAEGGDGEAARVSCPDHAHTHRRAGPAGGASQPGPTALPWKGGLLPSRELCGRGREEPGGGPRGVCSEPGQDRGTRADAVDEWRAVLGQDVHFPRLIVQPASGRCAVLPAGASDKRPKAQTDPVPVGFQQTVQGRAGWWT